MWPWLSSSPKFANHSLLTNNIPKRLSSSEECNRQIFAKLNCMTMYETWNKMVKPQLTCCDTNSQLWGLKPCDLDCEHGNPNILNGGQVCLLMMHQHAGFACEGFRAQKAHGSQLFSEVLNPVTLTLSIVPQTLHTSACMAIIQQHAEFGASLMLQ